MGVPSAPDDDRPPLTPVRLVLGRLAVGVRGSATLIALVAAPLGAVPPVSTGLLAPTLVVFAGWTAVYARRTWVGGLQTWLTAIDVAFCAGLCLGMGELVPVAAQGRGTGWVAIVSSMTAISAPLGGRLRVSVPIALIVPVASVIGSHRAGVPDGGVVQAFLLVGQLSASAVVVVIAQRAAARADAAFAELQVAQQAAEIERIKRADQLAQLRLLHNGALTTLTMAAHTRARPTPMLRARAASDLESLPALGRSHEPSATEGFVVRLDLRLREVVTRFASVVDVTSRLEPSSVPAEVGAAFAEATGEALENVVRHSGSTRADVTLCEVGPVVEVSVVDHGVGLPAGRAGDDAATGTGWMGFGLRESVIGQMAAIGGAATIGTAADGGVMVTLRWAYV